MVFLVVATTANMHDEIVMYSATCTRGGGGSSANVGQVVYTLVLVHRHMVEIFNVCVHGKHIILLEKSKGMHIAHEANMCTHDYMWR